MNLQVELNPGPVPIWESGVWWFWFSIENLSKSAHWAWLDVKCQYRRSKIGPLWETINVAVMTAGLTVISAAIFGGKVSGVIGYVGLGLILWTAISTLITEGASTFLRSRHYILNSNISLDLYLGHTVFTSLITFAHHSVLYFVTLALGIVSL